MVIAARETKIKPGYKQTEVGVIPEDWEVKTLGEVASVSSGGTPDRTNTAYWNGDIPWVTTTQIDFNLIDRANEFITQKGLENSAAKVYHPGTLLLAMYGQGKTRGKVALLAIDAAINQACAAIKPNKDVEGKYLFFSLSARYEEIRQLSNTGNQENLNSTIIKNILIPLPSEEKERKGKKEQQAITTALSDIDALIASLDRLIAKKRDIKQATMQQLLTGRMRLPGFSGEWQRRTFEEVMTGFVSGATPSRKRPDFFQGDIPWITSGELKYSIITNTIERISQEAMFKTNLKLLPKGTFLIAITGLEAEGTRGSCGIVGIEATTNQSCMALFPTRELSNDYLFHYYVHKGKSLALEYCQGTKQQSYTGKIVKLLPILLPPTIEEQRAIAAILSDMDAEIVALEQKREKTRALKQGMMQELLTGKTRLL